MSFPRLPLAFEVAPHPNKETRPSTGWIPAQVPGAVQLDWARAHGWPEYWKANHFQDYAWMEDSYWTYRARLEFPALASSERLFFVGRGVDYQFEVYAGDTLLHAQEGMFAPFEIDLTGRVRAGAELRILVFPAPKSQASPADLPEWKTDRFTLRLHVDDRPEYDSEYQLVYVPKKNSGTTETTRTMNL